MNGVPAETTHVHIVEVGTALTCAKETNMMEVESEMRGMSEDDDSIGEEDGFVTANLIHDGGIEVGIYIIYYAWEFPQNVGSVA